MMSLSDEESCLSQSNPATVVNTLDDVEISNEFLKRRKPSIIRHIVNAMQKKLDLNDSFPSAI